MPWRPPTGVDLETEFSRRKGHLDWVRVEKVKVGGGVEAGEEHVQRACGGKEPGEQERAEGRAHVHKGRREEVWMCRLANLAGARPSFKL